MRLLVQLRPTGPPRIFSKVSSETLRNWYIEQGLIRRDQLAIYTEIWKGIVLQGWCEPLALDFVFWEPKRRAGTLYVGRNGRGQMVKYAPGFRPFPLETLAAGIDLDILHVVDLERAQS